VTAWLTSLVGPTGVPDIVKQMIATRTEDALRALDGVPAGEPADAPACLPRTAAWRSS
jgi:hypothetical protein